MKNSTLSLGGAVQNNPITFRIWKSAENKEYNAAAVFSTGGHYGESFATAVSSLSTAGDALPVEMTSFTASVNGGNAILQWVTATELNNYGFEIERASSGLNGSNSGFEKIGFVKGHGNSSSVLKYSYTDRLTESGKYLYRLKQIDSDGTYKYSKEIEAVNSVPSAFTLGQNYPNPFNPSTNINFSLKNASNVELTVYNAIGEKVAQLVNEKKEAGNYSVSFDAKKLASGIYLYSLKAGSNYAVKKMNLIK